jgi:hypothetical protein
MNDIQMARVLGLLSLGLGAAEIALPRCVSHELGLEKPHVVEAFGGREILNGLLALGYPDRAWPIWARVGGDVLDLAVLAVALGSGNRRRHNAAWAALGVLGVTLADIAVAVALTRREQKALATARRTRIRRKPGTELPKTA